MDQAVQASEFPVQRVGQLSVVFRRGALQVHGIERRLRVAGGHDGVIGILEPVYVLVEQYQAGTVRGQALGQGAADAVGGAGQQDDAPGKQVRRRLPVGQ